MYKYIISFVLASVVVLATATVLWIRNRFNFWKNIGVPYEQPSLPYGNLNGLGKNLSFIQLTRNLYKKFKHKSTMVGLFFFVRPVALIVDLDIIKYILVRDFHHFQSRGLFFNEKDDPLSAHLVNIEGSKWKSLRAKLTPTFTSGKMKLMFPLIIDVASRLKRKLGEFAELNESADIKIINGRFTMDVIGSCAFGIECNSLFGEQKQFHEMGLKVFKEPRHSRLVVMFFSTFKRLAKALHVKTVRDDVSEFFLGVVRDSIATRKSQNLLRNDFMDILIKLMKNGSNDNDLDNDGLTMNEVAAQAFVFFLAGFETSSTLMTFCMFELSQNQEIQDKLRKHIDTVLQKHNGELTYDAIMEMNYLDQVLNETLRKYPPAANIIRCCTMDYKVPGTDFILPKGVSAVIPVYSIHHDEDIYPDPDVFNPDRFTEEEKRKRGSMTFLPFGEGPRNCIGLRFGMMQARVGMISVIQNFKISLNEKTKLPMNFSFKDLILSFSEKVYLDFVSVK